MKKSLAEAITNDLIEQELVDVDDFGQVQGIIQNHLNTLFPDVQKVLSQMDENPEDDQGPYGDRFPVDDEFSIYQRDGYCDPCDLSIYYAHQFVQGETYFNPENDVRFGHSPVLKGTVTGTIYFKDVAMQNFVQQEEGHFLLTKVDKTSLELLREITFDNDEKGDYLYLSVSPGYPPKPETAIKLVIDYEYDMECTS